MMRGVWLVCLAAACSGQEDGEGGSTEAPPFPDCITIDQEGVISEVVRVFDGERLVEERTDGVTTATYTYDGEQLASRSTDDEDWTFTWSPNGITSILITDPAGADQGEYTFFYDLSGHLTDLVRRSPDGTTDVILDLEWLDATTSESTSGRTEFVQSALQPPIADPLRDPAGLLTTAQTTPQDTPLFQRDLDAAGVPVEERRYAFEEVVERRTWAFCDE